MGYLLNLSSLHFLAVSFLKKALPRNGTLRENLARRMLHSITDSVLSFSRRITFWREFLTTLLITTYKALYKTARDKASLFTALPTCVTLCPPAHALFQLTFHSLVLPIFLLLFKHSSFLILVACGTLKTH